MVNPVNTSQAAIANPFTKQVDEQAKNQPRKSENDNKAQESRKTEEGRENRDTTRQASAAQSGNSQRRETNDSGSQQRGSLVDLSV